MKGTRTDRAFTWLGYTSTLVIIAIAAWVAFLDVPPLRYPVQPFPVLSLRVFPGDPVLMQVRRISTEAEESSYTSARWLVNMETGERVPLNPGVFSATPGDHTPPPSLNLVIPKEILDEHPPGFYYAAGSVSVDGKVRNHKVPWRSAAFEIVRPGAQP